MLNPQNSSQDKQQFLPGRCPLAFSVPDSCSNHRSIAKDRRKGSVSDALRIGIMKASNPRAEVKQERSGDYSQVLHTPYGMMQITLAFLALLVTPALIRGGISYNSRLLLATEDDVFDEGDTSEVGTVYQEVGFSSFWLGSLLVPLHLTVLTNPAQPTSLSCLQTRLVFILFDDNSLPFILCCHCTLSPGGRAVETLHKRT